MDRRLACLAAALLCACSGPTGPQPATLTPIERGTQPKVLWSASTGDGYPYVFSPAFADGAVYTAARNGTVSRYDVRNGLCLSLATHDAVTRGQLTIEGTAWFTVQGCRYIDGTAPVIFVRT